MTGVRRWTPADAPTLAHYSALAEAGGLRFLSGQVGNAFENGVPTGFAEQWSLALSRVDGLLTAAETDRTSIVKVTAYLVDANDFDAFDAAFALAFPVDPPARTTVVVASLPRPGLFIELDIVAVDTH